MNGGRENVLHTWSCLLGVTEFRGMSSWLVVELKFQSLVKEGALESDAWIQILSLLFTSCVTLVMLFNLSGPQFPLL